MQAHERVADSALAFPRPATPYAGRRYGRANLMLGSAVRGGPQRGAGALFRRGPAHALPSPFFWAGGLAKRPVNIGLFAQPWTCPAQSGSLGAFIKPQPYETVKARTLRRSRHSCVAAPGSGPKRAEGSDRRPFGYAAFFSRSCFHCPRVARLFIMARWMKARWAAATFSLLPDQAFCGAACSARP